MTRHAVIAADPSLEAVLHEAETGPVELVRNGEPVAVVLSMADYQRLTSTPRQRFWDALQRFRSETDLDELDIDGILGGVRERSAGREVVAEQPWPLLSPPTACASRPGAILRA